MTKSSSGEPERFNKSTKEPVVFTREEKFRMMTVFSIAAAALLLTIFEVVADNLHTELVSYFDRAFGSWVRAFRTEPLTFLMRSVAQFGSSQVLILIALVAGAYLWLSLRKKWEAFLLLTGLFGSWLANSLLKLIFERPRPGIGRLADASGYSFPSGNAMISIAFYGFIAYLIMQGAAGKNPAAKKTVLLSAVLFILLIGLSRIYLGVHYPTDILAGYAAGGIWLTAVIYGLKAIRYYTYTKKNSIEAKLSDRLKKNP
ncbi:phosphatase PAP2 family protein [Ferviditalea candida]|uniref:Phosphatase PAP2 family protein n=1 Tax=Ferviditalea candida TaxID=3108399 RepID=A0ABU5ZET4_9BACL|nr:phosphatase PAP2 family protein [Paenibacillaceae bacterium T2]